jgi:hypothetical protein
VNELNISQQFGIGRLTIAEEADLNELQAIFDPVVNRILDLISYHLLDAEGGITVLIVVRGY